MAAVMRSCRSQQLVGKLCDALCQDRSAKLRLCCAEWLLQVIFFQLKLTAHILWQPRLRMTGAFQPGD